MKNVEWFQPDNPHAIIMQGIPELFFHGMLPGKVQDVLCLEHSHRDSIEEQLLPDGEDGCLFEAFSYKLFAFFTFFHFFVSEK